MYWYHFLFKTQPFVLFGLALRALASCDLSAAEDTSTLPTKPGGMLVPASG
jgi:hypothetical protein